MNAELGLIFGILIFGMALLVGVAIGFQLSEDQRTAGNLVIAPGDEDAPNYMFLDLDMNPESLTKDEKVVLRVKKITARK
ncbi:hypothetical protein [Faecalibacterium hattorii]|uniref:Uncharacterized protein n=1 Tax=Faecalibacterium hattorii TaxID=2935520 RepID=A0A329ULD7_9FIRM|nr:hypothetical protein [Faecalibacterium hattorii]RAW63536.1 hypothetical protein C4N23_00535 [Faecalibacterium hattorii]